MDKIYCPINDDTTFKKVLIALEPLIKEGQTIHLSRMDSDHIKGEYRPRANYSPSTAGYRI